MLEVNALTLSRGGRCIQRDVSFSLARGEALQLFGSNGVGKSTLLHALVGLLEPDTGEVLWHQQPLSYDRESWHRGLFFLPHKLPAHAVLTPLEILRDSLALKGISPSRQQLEEALLAVELLDQADQAAGSLSAGQQRRIWLARLVLSLRLLQSEVLWLLDEPLTSLDKNAQALVVSLLRQQMQRDGMVLLTSHQTVELAGLKTLLLPVADL